MSTAFVVTQIVCDYDGGSSYPVLVTPYRPIADRFVEGMKARLVVCNTAKDAIDQHMATFDSHNPRPHFATYREQPLPHYGPKKSKWTAEQKAEYNKVKTANQDGCIEAGKPMRDWIHTRYDELKRFKATFPQQVQDDLGLDKETFWEIEEAPFAEQPV
jgi:hypothetical protein